VAGAYCAFAVALASYFEWPPSRAVKGFMDTRARADYGVIEALRTSHGDVQ
jgi:hypothetical protein